MKNSRDLIPDIVVYIEIIERQVSQILDFIY